MSNALDRNNPVVALASTSIGFAMMCVGKFMAVINVQVVATSLPTIHSALTSRRSWINPNSARGNWRCDLALFASGLDRVWR
jgi:hypothetical protein